MKISRSTVTVIGAIFTYCLNICGLLTSTCRCTDVRTYMYICTCTSSLDRDSLYTCFWFCTVNKLFGAAPTCTCTCTCTHIHVPIRTCTYIYLYVHVHTCTMLDTKMFTCIVHIYMYVRMYHVCTYVHVHVHENQW